MQRVRRIDQQRLQVGCCSGVRELDVGIEEPAQKVRVLDGLSSANIQVGLDLCPGFVLNLLRATLHRWFAVEDAWSLPIGDVRREEPANLSVPIVRQVCLLPELSL